MFRSTSSAERQRTGSSAIVLFVAFWIFVVFVIAQATWWVLFGIRSIDEHTQTALQNWEQSAASARLWYGAEMRSALLSDEAMIVQQIIGVYPDLVFDKENPELFHVKQSTIDEFLSRQYRMRVMFFFESPFFAFIVLVMLFLFAMRIRQADALQRRQANFLSAVTHELKTPLSTLRLLVQTMQLRNPTTEKREEYLQSMEESLTRLNQHTDNLLAAARLEHDEHTMPLTNTEVNELVREVSEQLQPGLRQRGGELSVTVDSSPIFARVHREHFLVIFSNLFDNAMKYTETTPKRVDVSIVGMRDHVLVHVDDAGVGITNGNYANIFDRFYRPGDELTRSSTGVGLGLSLTRDAVLAMNGTIRATSNPNHATGTRFTIRLPRTPGGTP